MKGNAETGLMQIRAVLPRRTKFERADYNKGAYLGDQVVCANVDVLFVVVALDQGLNENRLVRYLAQGTASGAETVVVLNKADLCDDIDGALALARRAAKCDVIAVSAVSGDGLEGIRRRLGRAVTGAMLGPSGAGKSTIINALLGEERFATAEVREGDSKGRHTTTHRELVTLPGGGMLIDNPGMRSIGLTGGEDVVGSAFEDVEALIRQCRFSDCQHRTEPGCAVKAAIESGALTGERFEAYKRLQREIWIVSVKKSQRSRQGAELSMAIKRRQRMEKLGY